MTTERAQALEALKRLARDIGLVDDVAGRRGDPDAEHQQMRRRLKAWESEIFKALDLLAVPPPPPVGSPTTADVFKAGFQAAQRWGVDMEHEAWEDFATSVEPTPEPPVHNDLCSWCLTQADHVAASEECYERNSQRGRSAPVSTGEPAPAVEREGMTAPKNECGKCRMLGSIGPCDEHGPLGVSPSPVVEPTPEPCRCEIYQSCEKCRKTDPVVFGAEQPTGAPAPCVWRDVGDALFFISAPGCGTKHKHAWPYRSIVGWSHCPYCGHPLTVER